MDRLEKLIESLKQSGDSAGHDPQMEKLDGMLDKIITIQHPEMMTTAESKPVRPVQTPAVASAGPDSGTVRILGPAQPAADTGKPSASGEEDGFFAFDDNNDSPPESENTIHAVVSEDQTLVSGATIKLRLTEDARVGGMTLPSDTYIYGTANLNNERLNISIKSVIEGNSIYPVNWQVFDLDGMSGIFIPGAISRDVAKESAAEGISGMGVSSLDASLGAQAANAGIQAAKDLVSKKIKLIKVSVKAGYEVLLKENKTAS
jgi:conjugative transposon TraM protein